jgi:hypothetical protein
MLLSELFVGLFEARKNSEMNPKLSPVEVLRKYKDDPNIFISFKGIPKVGMNPKYNFNTPMGVYFYPLNAFWNHFRADFEAGKMPKTFATEYRYCYIIKYNGKGSKEIRDTNKYTKAERMHDFELLRKMGFDVDEAVKNIPNNQYTKNDFGIFWNTLNVLTSHIKGLDKLGTNRLALEKNKILRQLGYSYISEPGGSGIIHPNEVEQGFFTSGAYIKTIDVIDQTRWKISGNPDPTVSNISSLLRVLTDEISNYMDDYNDNISDYVDSMQDVGMDVEEWKPLEVEVSLDEATKKYIIVKQTKPTVELLGYINIIDRKTIQILGTNKSMVLGSFKVADYKIDPESGYSVLTMDLINDLLSTCSPQVSDIQDMIDDYNLGEFH